MLSMTPLGMPCAHGDEVSATTRSAPMTVGLTGGYDVGIQYAPDHLEEFRHIGVPARFPRPGRVIKRLRLQELDQHGL